ncbi:hypothetical protein DAI22_08g194166 [Oryza sativa Japonica Group]|nr:hypothetical protein DAI22_08g194166 [Oryza sativa Japonica Group]
MSPSRQAHARSQGEASWRLLTSSSSRASQRGAQGRARRSKDEVKQGDGWDGSAGLLEEERVRVETIGEDRW